MRQRTPKSTRTDTIFPCTSLFRTIEHFAKANIPLHLIHQPTPVEPVDRDRLADQRQHDRLPQQQRPERRQLRLALQRQPFVPPVDELDAHPLLGSRVRGRSEEHTSELQSLMRTSYAVFCLKKKNIGN